ncbi:hypothetical protein K461DRAFT_274229 [Myriangium duriaei CBS 260.36]|uniref:Uncharacterized protein n=1 Tax=Myriangium duriaei CBS 260.36 TaxID=1168546 RepID=A0A9P4JAI1_9PEZI|nr:hypothetical protein K461DRAFT_274229 [Myriangium duriaei CBS 260.36]
MVDPFEHILLRPWQSQGTIAANVDRAPQQCTTPSSSSASGPSTPESFDWLPSHWTTSTTRPAHPVQVTRDFHQFNDESSQVHQMQQKRQPSMQLSCRNPTQDLPQYGLSFLGGQPESSEPINSHAQMHLVDHMFPMSVQQPATQAQSQNYDPLMSLT